MTTKNATSSRKKINKKIETKINHTFYYDRKKVAYLALFNICLVTLISTAILSLLNSGLLTSTILLAYHMFVIVLSVLALLGSLFVVIFPQRLALLTNEGITIDHNETLKWKDIEIAKEVKANYLYPQPAIALLTKEGVEHKLTFMQIICKNNLFTSFSIPLYAMKKEDATKIQKIIKQKCKYSDATK